MRISERQLELKHFFTHNTNDTTFNFLGHGSIHTTTVYLLHPPPQPPSLPHPTTSTHYKNDRRPWIVAAIEDTLKLQLRHPLTLKPHPSTLPKTNFTYSSLAVSYHASYFFDKLVLTEDHALFALYNGGVLRARPGNGTDWVTLNDGDPENRFDDIVVFKGKVYVLYRDGRLNSVNNYVNSGQISMGKSVVKRAVGSEFKWRKRVVVDGEKRMYLVVRTGEKGLAVYKQITRGKAVYWDEVKGFDGNKVLFMSRDYCFFLRASVIGVKGYKNCIVFTEEAFPRYGYNYWEFSSFNWSWTNGQKQVAVFRLKDQKFSAGSKIKWSAPYWTKQQSSGLSVASLRAYAARCRISGVQVNQVSEVDQSQLSSDSDIESERDPDEDEEFDSDGQEEEEEEEEVQSDSKGSASKDDKQEVESDSDSEDKDQEGEEPDSGSEDQDQEGVESDSSSQDQEEEKMQCDSNSQEKEDEQTHLNANTDGEASLQEDTEISRRQQSQTPSKKFTHKTDESAFTSRPTYVYSTTIYLLRPPHSLSSECPCIIASEIADDYDGTVIFRHPLTSKPPFWDLPQNFDISEFHPSPLSVTYHFEESYPVDKLLVVPTPPSSYLGDLINVEKCTFFALYGGGELQGCPRAVSRRSYGTMTGASNSNSAWVKLSSGEKFDDIIIFQDQIYAVDRQGFTKLINNYKTTRKISIGKYLCSVPITSVSGRFGWRKRLVVDGATLYVVVRTVEKSFKVFMLEWGHSRPAKVVYWKMVTEFDGKKVLFMARDHYFFRQASKKFPGRKYKNCIVFSEAAFPQYGKDCWEFTESDRQFGEENIAVFWLDDKTFVREGEKSRFPKIDWSPPAWVFLAAKSQSTSSQSEREPDEDEGLDSDSEEKNNGEEQSHSKGSDSKDEEEEEEEEMESDLGSQDQDQEKVESDSGSQDQEEEKMECDTNIQEKEDEEMALNANTDVGASLQKDVSPSLLGPKTGTTDTQTPLAAAEDEITRTLLSLNGASAAIEEETSKKNITTESVLKACTSSTTKSQTSEYATAKFEGFDIRSDLVSTLEKIWRKHGNIVEKSIIRNSDIIARALESLATVVRVLEDNTAHSLSDTQADYLASTLSDLRCICFKVYWLIPYVQKAIKIHKSKSSVESLNNLSQLSSQVKKRKAILLEELDKLGTEEKKLKEEMEKVSQLIPFRGQVKLDEPLGAGLT